MHVFFMHLISQGEEGKKIQWIKDPFTFQIQKVDETKARIKH